MWQEFCQSFCQTTLLSAQALALSDPPRVPPDIALSFCGACGRAEGQAPHNCLSERLMVLLAGATSPGPQIHECPFGVLNAAIPLGGEKHPSGLLLIGRALSSPLDPGHARKKAVSQGLEARRAVESLSRLPVLTMGRLASAVRMVRVAAGHLVAEDNGNHKDIQRVERIQAMLRAHRSFSHAVGRDEIRTAVVGQLAQALEAERVMLVAPEDGDKGFRIIASHGLSTKPGGAIRGVAAEALQRVLDDGIVLRPELTSDDGQALFSSLGGPSKDAHFALVPMAASEEASLILALLLPEGCLPGEPGDDEILLGIGHQAAAALENSRIYQDNLRRTFTLARLSRTMVHISLSQDEGQILDFSVGIAGELLAAPLAAVLLWNESEQRFRIDPHHGHLGLAPEVIDAVNREDLTDLRTIMEEGCLVKVGETPENPSLRAPTSLASGAKALMIAPLIAGPERVGALLIGDRQRRRFSDDDCSILMLLASHTASAIASARKLEDERRRGRESEALNEVARKINSPLELEDVLQVVMEKTIQLTGTDACAIILRKSGGKFEKCGSVGIQGGEYGWERGKLHRVLAEEALRTGRVVIDLDLPNSVHSACPEAILEQGIRTTATAPMLAGAKPIGTLNVYTTKPHHYSDEQLRLLASLAGHAAVAIEKSRLHTRAADASRRLESALQQLASTLASGEDLPGTLEMIPRLARELMAAKASGIALVDPIQGTISHASWSGPEFLRGMMDERLTSWLLSGSTCNDGAVLLPSLDDCGADPILRAARRLGLRSFLSVPIVVGGEAIGLLGVLKGSPHHFTAPEVELLATFANQAAVAVEKARLRDQRHHIAEALQRSLLPAELPKIPGIECGKYYRAAAKHAQVGGDFFDVLRLADGRWLIAVGDVCGHGTEAAVSTAMDKYAMRAYVTEDPSPDRVLQRLNRTRCQQSAPTEFTTLFCALYDPERREIEFGNAGSPPLVCCGADGEIRVSTLVDPPVGLPFVDLYRSETWQFAPGDVFILYTDGLYEAKNEAGEEFGEERIRQALVRHRTLPAQRLAERIFRELHHHTGDGIPDDIALLVFKVLEPEG